MFSELLNLREAVFAAVTGLLLSLVCREDGRYLLRPTLSNGTHPWAPTVLLLSLDGFKPAYLQSGYVPTLDALAHGRWPQGLANRHHTHPALLTADYMLPVSPSLTFPNHWSLQTGLHPSSHGIVANDFHLAPHSNGKLAKNSSFYYTDPAQSWDAKWWKGVSIWEHLESIGVKTANLMWPGPPVTSRNVTSTIFQEYEKGWTLAQRHDRIMDWLDRDIDDRPRFVCAYAPDVDTATHNLGPDPNLKPVATALRNVDRYVHTLLDSIAERNASSIVNVIVVSDHGMTFTSNDRLLYLDDILGSEIFSSILTQDGWPNAGLRFRSTSMRDAAHERMRDERKRWKRRGVEAFDIVERNDLVARWNWTMSEVAKERMADLWMVPRVGWSITTQHEMIALHNDYIPRGNHGYDADHPDMHAFFVAAGPAVVPRATSDIAPFANLEIHNLVMAMLGVKGAPNEGTKDFWSATIAGP